VLHRRKSEKLDMQKGTLTVMSIVMKLQTHMVEKPWGREDIAKVFCAPWGRRIGEIWYDDGGATPLPLLVKWLFTSEKLSVQVHPNDTQAQERGAHSGKEECWYIVSAEPGAVIGIGTLKQLDGDALRAASLDGSIEDLIDWKPVQAGDYYYIPAGTVHAIGAGITLVEVQQYADITYRLYDYGRLDKGKPRELHLEDGVAVSRAESYCDHRSGNTMVSKQLVDGPHFRLWLVNDAETLALLPTDKRRWIVPLNGEVYADEEIGKIGDCMLADAGVYVSMSEEAQILVATQI
jgi:mannose-6-phosphate isomerase